MSDQPVDAVFGDALGAMVGALSLLSSVQSDGVVLAGSGSRVVVTGIPSVDLNGVFVLVPDPDAGEVARLASIAHGHITGPLPWSILVPGESSPAIRAVAVSHGLTAAARQPIYARRLDPVPPAVALPSGTLIRRVSADQADHFVAGLAVCWGVTEQSFRRLASSDLLVSLRVNAWVTEQNGEVTATALGIAVDEWVAVMAVATRPDQRRRGLGGAVTAAVLRDSARRGTRWAALMPTEAGAPLYRRIGFTEVGAVTVLSAETTVGKMGRRL